MTDQNNTTAGMVADLRRLTEPARKSRQPLKTLQPRGALDAKRGRGDYAAKSKNGNGGMAGPLDEVAGTVTWWPSGYKTSDGIFFLPAERQRTFLDANGDTQIIRYANPEGSA